MYYSVYTSHETDTWLEDPYVRHDKIWRYKLIIIYILDKIIRGIN